MQRLTLGFALLVVGLFAFEASAADDKDSAKAAKTRELLKKKVTLTFGQPKD